MKNKNIFIDMELFTKRCSERLRFCFTRVPGGYIAETYENDNIIFIPEGLSSIQQVERNKLLNHEPNK